MTLCNYMTDKRDEEHEQIHLTRKQIIMLTNPSLNHELAGRTGRGSGPLRFHAVHTREECQGA